MKLILLILTIIMLISFSNAILQERAYSKKLLDWIENRDGVSFGVTVEPGLFDAFDADGFLKAKINLKDFKSGN